MPAELVERGVEEVVVVEVADLGRGDGGGECGVGVVVEGG